MRSRELNGFENGEAIVYKKRNYKLNKPHRLTMVRHFVMRSRHGILILILKLKIALLHTKNIFKTD